MFLRPEREIKTRSLAEIEADMRNVIANNGGLPLESGPTPSELAERMMQQIRVRLVAQLGNALYQGLLPYFSSNKSAEIVDMLLRAEILPRFDIIHWKHHAGEIAYSKLVKLQEKYEGKVPPAVIRAMCKIQAYRIFNKFLQLVRDRISYEMLFPFVFELVINTQSDAAKHFAAILSPEALEHLRRVCTYETLEEIQRDRESILSILGEYQAELQIIPDTQEQVRQDMFDPLPDF